jgi:hypothetical protein
MTAKPAKNYVTIAALSVDLKITKEGVEEPIRAAADGRRAPQYYRRPARSHRKAHRARQGMTDEPKNLTLKLLRKMRADMLKGF